MMRKAGIDSACSFPIMVSVDRWFEEWLRVTGGGSGGLTPEAIPDGVLWASIDKVLVRDTDGTYILRSG